MPGISEKLKSSIKEGRMMHGYLITGADPTDCEQLMLECAALLLFNNENTELLKLSPDFFLLDGTVRIDDIREIRREVNKTTFSSARRVVLIKNAHLLNDFSINAMLKMLEEPPEGTFFFLSGIEQRIIPTIRSRCMIIRLGGGEPMAAEKRIIKEGISGAEAIELIEMANGSADIALQLHNDEAYRKTRENAVRSFIALMNGELPFAFAKALNKDRAAAIDSITFMLNACHDLLSIKSGTDGSATLTARDHAGELNKIAAFSSFSEIGEVIAELTATIERLNSNAGVNPILDRLIVDISEIVMKNRQ